VQADQASCEYRMRVVRYPLRDIRYPYLLQRAHTVPEQNSKFDTQNTRGLKL
jgi:hypothetical protein